jgi:hypothetical protein
MDFPHLVQNLPLTLDVKQNYPREFQLFPEAEEKNMRDKDS